MEVVRKVGVLERRRAALFWKPYEQDTKLLYITDRKLYDDLSIGTIGDDLGMT